MSEPLSPSPQLLEKLVGILHATLHAVPSDSALGRLCRDDEVIAWSRAMREIGLLPPLPPLPVYEERKP